MMTENKNQNHTFNFKGKYDSLINKIDELIRGGVDNENWREALECSRDAVKRNRLNMRANYMLAVCAEKTHEWLESYHFYSNLYKLQLIYKNEIISENELLIKIEEVMNRAIEQLPKLPEEKQTAYKNSLFAINELDKDIQGNYFTIKEHIDGYFGIHRYFGKEYYIGRYNAWFPYYICSNPMENGVVMKSEIYEIAEQGKSITVDESFTLFPCILPVVTNIEDKMNILSLEDNSHQDVKSFPNGYAKAYEYYRLEKPVTLSAEQTMVIGKPVQLRHRQGNKKLVLNIFIDSLNYKCISGDKLRIFMPNTYNFFKKGVICNEFYAGSEFTYPSVASYWTGYRSTHHQMLNSNIHYPIPDDMPLLSESFHDNGYFTCKIGGNDSTCPQYGYIRGIDRTLYGYSEAVFHASECVNEAIEHMEAFKETDNFIWLEFQDLHYVAAYWPMPLSVQAHLPIEVNVVDNIGGSGLYQTPSPNRRMVYEQQMVYLDSQLKRIYDYILEHYAEDEVVVSLISDHGNGFNVDEGNFFICEQRVNVPLMLRSGSLPSAVLDERIESIDYSHIMLHLAGIDDEKMSKNDGGLPKFFGGEREKEYVFSQSLFPDRYYSAMVLINDYSFYIQSAGKAGNDCRVSLENAHFELRNGKGVAVDNKEVCDKCIEIIKEQLGDFELD